MTKRYSPAAERNQLPIFEVLNPLLRQHARVLEVASGSGQHAAFVCQQRPDIVWQPTDIDPESLASIRAFQLECRGLQEPLAWSIVDERPLALQGPYDVLVNINMVHISPWEACQSLMKQAAGILREGANLFMYGPFLVKDRETAPSNLEFDRSLKSRNPAWGLRTSEQVAAEAEARGLLLKQTVNMPANNLSLVFQRQ